jgi:hypothetical protein
MGGSGWVHSNMVRFFGVVQTLNDINQLNIARLDQNTCILFIKVNILEIGQFKS